MPLHLSEGGAGTRLQPRYGARARAVLWGGSAAALPAAVETAARTFGLPHPTIGGVRAKQSPAAAKGYFLMAMNESTLEQTMDLASASGMPYITMLLSSWAQGSGHCAPSFGPPARSAALVAHGAQCPTLLLRARSASSTPYTALVFERSNYDASFYI